MSIAGGPADSGATESLALAPQFLDIVACPACHGTLAIDYESSSLVCDCGLAYPVRDGIPVLLIDEARRVGGPGVPTGDVLGL